MTFIIRGFPKADHSGNSTRIVLNQNKFSKKLPLTVKNLQLTYSTIPIILPDPGRVIFSLVFEWKEIHIFWDEDTF